MPKKAGLRIHGSWTGVKSWMPEDSGASAAFQVNGTNRGRAHGSTVERLGVEQLQVDSTYHVTNGSEPTETGWANRGALFDRYRQHGVGEIVFSAVTGSQWCETAAEFVPYRCAPR